MEDALKSHAWVRVCTGHCLLMTGQLNLNGVTSKNIVVKRKVSSTKLRTCLIKLVQTKCVTVLINFTDEFLTN